MNKRILILIPVLVILVMPFLVQIPKSFANITVTTTITVPPSTLSIHFWWYPFFTLLIFDSLFFSVALAMRVPQEDLIFMALVGFVHASWIAYFMQTLPLYIPIMFCAAFVVYEWRAVV